MKFEHSMAMTEPAAARPETTWYEKYLDSHGWKRVGDNHWNKILRTLQSSTDARADLYLTEEGWQLVVMDTGPWGILYNDRFEKDALAVRIGCVQEIGNRLSSGAFFKWSKGVHGMRCQDICCSGTQGPVS